MFVTLQSASRFSDPRRCRQSPQLRAVRARLLRPAGSATPWRGQFLCYFGTANFVCAKLKVMKPPKQKYPDSQGVWRGGYVYQHKDNESGSIFYIGKGIGNRAWEKRRRTDQWKAKVASLATGYTVEIQEDDLTEREALLLEMATIHELTSSREGSQLVNGSTGVVLSPKTLASDPARQSVLSSLFNLASEYTLANRAKYRIIELTKEDKLCLLDEFEKQWREFRQRAIRFADELSDSENCGVSDLGLTLECAVNTLSEDLSDVRDRRLAWGDFCNSLIDNFYDLKTNLEIDLWEGEEIEPRFLPGIEFASMVTAAMKGFVNRVTVPKDANHEG